MTSAPNHLLADTLITHELVDGGSKKILNGRFIVVTMAHIVVTEMH